MAFLLWRALSDRLPTKENLLKRGIIVEEVDHLWPLCNQHLETSYHIFLNYDFVQKVWLECYSWIAQDFAIVLPESI